MYPHEEWYPIRGIPGYEITTDAQVRSPRKILKQWVGRDGLKRVQIRDKPHLVHILMLTTFVSPRPDGGRARFKSGDTADCRLENLRWREPKRPVSVSRLCSKGHEMSGRVCWACVEGAPPVVDLPDVI